VTAEIIYHAAATGPHVRDDKVMNMPAGRPSKYNPVVYGLTDKDGVVFYVGQTKNLQQRMSAYKSGRCHGNRSLSAMIEKHGVNHVILRSGCKDLTSEEFEEIEARSGLVNLITSRSQALRYAKTTKPWIVSGVASPSTAYMRHMKNAFNTSCQWMKDELNSQSDGDRVKSELRIAQTFLQTPIGPACNKWMEAINGRA